MSLAVRTLESDRFKRAIGPSNDILHNTSDRKSRGLWFLERTLAPIVGDSAPKVYYRLRFIGPCSFWANS